MFVFENFSVYAHDTVAAQARLYFFFCLLILSFPFSLSLSLSCHLLSSFICWPFETCAIFCLGLFILNLWWGCTCICRVAAFYVGYICFSLSLFTRTLDTDFLLPVLRIVFCLLSACSFSFSWKPLSVFNSKNIFNWVKVVWFSKHYIPCRVIVFSRLPDQRIL